MKRVVFMVAGFTQLACATSGQSSSSDGLPSIASAGRNVITAAEIVASRVSDVYQAVTQLRPEYLRRRSAAPAVPQIGSSPTLAVYLDDLPYGGVESLRSIPLDRVRLIRFVAPFEADLKWGGTHPAGAILVTTLP